MSSAVLGGRLAGTGLSGSEWGLYILYFGLVDALLLREEA